MKLPILLIVPLALACTDDEPVYTVTPELSGYVNTFYTEAQSRGKELPQENLIASLKSDNQAITEIKKDGDQWVLTFDKEAFDVMTAQGNPYNIIESYLFHELGRVVLKRELSSGFSIMNGNIKVNGFSTNDRSVLMDELFK